MPKRPLLGVLAVIAALLTARSADAKNNKLYVAWDQGISGCKGEMEDFLNCLLVDTNFNALASQYPNGRNLSLAGTSIITGCASEDFTCVVNKSGFPIADGDVVLHMWGNGCVGGTNNWDVYVNNIHIHGADVQSGGSCKCQEALSSHEVYEAAADAAAADCCNGQTWSPLDPKCAQFGAPGYGWYDLKCPNGTYGAQLLGEAAHEWDPSGCTQLSVAVPAPPMTQISGNEAMTLVNWPGSHAEIFVQSLSGDMFHAYPSDGKDNWTMPEKIDSGATCGAAAGFWPAPLSYAELFDPKSDGTPQHLWWNSNVWKPFIADMKGGMGLSHMSTLVWADGHMEVLALGSDKAIWHTHLKQGTDPAWATWETMGGSFTTGASALAWGDGHGELFATDAAGAAWHNWSGNFPGGWHGWESLGGDLASRPVPVRWADGHLEIFATGKDGQLYHSDYNSAWPAFSVLSPGDHIQGEPAAIMNPSGNGSAGGAEIFARDDKGKVVHLWWDKQYGAFSPQFDQTAASDPFAWIGPDGRATVFAIDESGALVHSYHGGADWTAWTPIGGMDLNPCVPASTSPDAGTIATNAATGSGAGVGGAGGAGGGGGAGGAGQLPQDGPGEPAGCGCRVEPSATTSGAWLSLAALMVLARRRHRRANTCARTRRARFDRRP